MKVLILVVCLMASAYANKDKKYDFNVAIDSVEFRNIPTKFKFGTYGNGDSINWNIPSLKDTLTEISQRMEKEPKAGTEAILNDFADRLFANVQSLVIRSGLDPMGLPEEHAGFNYTLIIVFHGELDLTNGWLLDLSTIHRGGDVIASYSTEDKFLEVTVPIAFNDLQFTYDYHADIMGLGPSGGIEGKVSDVAVEVKIGFDANSLLLTLDEFYITNSGQIDVNFDGNPLIDWLLNLLTDVVNTLLKPAILLIVEDIIRGGVDGLISAINDLINGIINPTTAAPTTTEAAIFFG